MSFEVKIKNFGKLDDSTISIKDLTIFAGPNNTGKSFFSKILYSVFDAMNANHMVAFISDLNPNRYSEINHFLRFMLEEIVDHHPKNTVQTQINKMQKEINNLTKLLNKIRSLANESTIVSSEKIHSDILKTIDEYKTTISYFADFEKPKKSPLFELIKNSKLSLERIYEKELIPSLNEIKKNLEILENSKSENIIKEGFIKILKDNLKGNFQTSNLNNLMKDSNQESYIEITDIGRITIKDKDNDHEVTSTINTTGLMKLQNYSRVIYLESPLFWKLRTALSRASRSRRFIGDRSKTNLLVPKYFTDLNYALEDELSGDVSFPDIIKEIQEKHIKGKIIINDSGELQFKENEGKSHSLPITATGIVQIGIIILLIEKKILDKDTVLVIDEPETNLHPSLQIEMIKLIIKLKEQGVQIIMATHSADIMKLLEIEIKKSPQIKESISLNQFGSAQNTTEQTLEDKIKSIKTSLTEPYFDLYLEGQMNE